MQLKLQTSLLVMKPPTLVKQTRTHTFVEDLKYNLGCVRFANNIAQRYDLPVTAYTARQQAQWVSLQVRVC